MPDNLDNTQEPHLDQPVSDDAAPEGAPAEPAPVPERVYAGKYRSPDALEQGYHEANKARELGLQELNGYRERERLRLEAEVAQNTPDPLDPLLEGHDEADQKLIKAAYEAGQMGGRTAAAGTTRDLLSPMLSAQQALAGRSAEDTAVLNQIMAEDQEFTQSFNNIAAVDVNSARMIADAAIQLRQSQLRAEGIHAGVTDQRVQSRLDAGIASTQGSGERGLPTDNSAIKARSERAEKTQAALQNYEQTRDIRQLAVDTSYGLEVWDENGRRKAQ